MKKAEVIPSPSRLRGGSLSKLAALGHSGAAKARLFFTFTFCLFNFLAASAADGLKAATLVVKTR